LGKRKQKIEGFSWKPSGFLVYQLVSIGFLFEIQILNKNDKPTDFFGLLSLNFFPFQFLKISQILNFLNYNQPVFNISKNWTRSVLSVVIDIWIHAITAHIMGLRNSNAGKTAAILF
jgi:hypothetical protein